MSAPDQALFSSLYTTFAADTGGTGLATLCGPGGFRRAGDDFRTAAVPRIEVSFAPMPDLGLASADKVLSVQVTLVAVADGGNALGTGNTPHAQGTIDQITDRMISLYENTRPTVTGWEPSKIDVSVPFTLPPIGKNVRRGVRLTLTMEEA